MIEESEIVQQKLDEYLHVYADDSIIGRSIAYQAYLISKDNNIFAFECQGSQLYPYDIRVDLNDIHNIKTQCNCPYREFGICKHEVAVLEELINLFDDNKLSLNYIPSARPKAQPQSKPIDTSINTLVHNGGVIDVDAINRMGFKRRSFYYSPIQIISLSRSHIEGFYDDYRKEFVINLSFDRAENKMELSCSCKSQMPCSHKAAFLEAVFDRYGTDYFHKKYIDRCKERAMKNSEYEGQIDFDVLFDLLITKEGVHLKEKVRNIVGANEDLIPFSEESESVFYLPNKSEATTSYGVSICFEKHKNEIVDVYPFYGKLNKAETQLSTKFRAIDESNLTEAFSHIKDKTQQEIITDGLLLSSIYAHKRNHNFTLEEVKSLITAFSELMNNQFQHPIYVWNVISSMVKKNFEEIKIVEKEVTPVLKISDKKPFYRLDFKIKVENQIYKINSTKLLITPFGIGVNNLFYPIRNAEIAYHLIKASVRPQLNVIQNGEEHLKNKIIVPFSKVFEIDYKGIKPDKKKSKKKTSKKKIEKHVYLSDEEGEFVVLHPVVQYGKTLISPESKQKIWTDSSKLSYLERNEEIENEFLADIKNLHPDFENQTTYFHLTVKEALNDMWLMQTIEDLQNSGVRVFGLNDLKSIHYNLNKPSFSTGLSSGTDWFDMDIDISFGNQKVDLKQLQKSIVKKSNYVELKDGTIGVMPKEWIEKYKKYFKLGQVKKDKIEISNYQFDIIDELYEEETNTPKFLEELHEKKKRLANLKDLKNVPKPKGIKATLRDYQREGLNWMVFLHENQLGGCLADDMGLGKTLQTIAFLQYLKNLPKKERTDLPHLIIAPTSLMFNWLAEFEKFAPKLKVLSFIGPNRDELIEDIPKHDVVLSTYGSMIKDVETHRKMEYNYVVLDESQAIKNPQSQRFKAVRLLKAKNRLALTGTPIENNTFDLYSQFSFLNPGIFGSIKHFRSTFSDAIDKEQDEYTSELLARMINPFLLRRTKTQVAKELPSKTESVIYCEMGKKQRQVYDHFKVYFKQKLQEQIEEEGVNKSQMYILQGLTKLRQICNSTALADKEKDYGNESAKLDELVRHLTEKVSNHKILVFSQFVGMLHLVKERLEQEGILFEYLDGQTRNREEKVNNFQNNDEIRVFLISLKAGGTGLNLTGADYVYLIDPWWNPAVESQAIDRCYRIGQDKKVMAYRMICKDTIEEKIVKLQDKKKAVAEDVIRIDKEKKSFDKGDVEMLFGIE